MTINMAARVIRLAAKARYGAWGARRARVKPRACHRHHDAM